MPFLLPLPALVTVCLNKSRPHPLCLFSEDTWRLFSSGIPILELVTATFVVPAQWLSSFLTLKSFFLLTYLLVSSHISHAYSTKLNELILNTHCLSLRRLHRDKWQLHRDKSKMVPSTRSSTEESSCNSRSFIPIGVSAAVHQLSRMRTYRPSRISSARDSFTMLRCITWTHSTQHTQTNIHTHSK